MAISFDLVTVVMPVFNEERVIGKTIESLLNQETEGFDLEIIIVDGLSTDTTAEIVRAYEEKYPNVRYLINEKRKTPFAFNLGIEQAKGEYIAILGAHCTYESNYIKECLRVVKENGAGGCSGKVITTPLNNSLQARLSSWLFGSTFGVSGNSFRTQKEGKADTVPYPVYLKKALLEVGGYNTTLHRNQDNLINEQIQRQGYDLYCTHRTSCLYYPKDRLSEVFKYMYWNGFWVAYSFLSHRESMSLRHLIPFLFFVFVSFGLLLVAFLPIHEHYIKYFYWVYFGVLILYLLLSVIQSLIIAFKERSPKPVILSVLFFPFHFSYGLGTCSGFLSHLLTPNKK